MTISRCGLSLDHPVLKGVQTWPLFLPFAFAQAQLFREPIEDVSGESD